MSNVKINLDRISVASPCSADWDLMEGGDRVRFCHQCGKHVYNFSNLSRQEAANLIADSEKRICAKFYRRADGTVLSSDCPVGLRAMRRRVSRIAGAVLSALLSLFPGSFLHAYQEKKELKADGGTYIITRRVDEGRAEEAKPVLSGTVYDINKAVVVNAEVTLTNERTKEAQTVNTNDGGVYRFSGVDAGVYTITVESPGFRRFTKSKLLLKSNEQVELDATLEVASMGEIVPVEM
jgi:hypothetical protein